MAMHNGPDYLVIGVQKGGTTALYRYLIGHAQVRPARDKQLHYFDKHYGNPVQWYEEQFPASGEVQGTVTGEATPYYMFHPACAARVHAHYPDVRLLALLRDPTERIWSHYHHERAKGAEDLDFDQALTAENERLGREADRLLNDPGHVSYNHIHYGYVARCRYAEQLRPWLELFGRDRFLFVQSERLFDDTRQTMDQVAGFLGIEPFPAQADLARRHNASRGKPAMPDGVRARLDAMFAPLNEELYALIGQRFDWGEHRAS